MIIIIQKKRDEVPALHNQNLHAAKFPNSIRPLLTPAASKFGVLPIRHELLPYRHRAYLPANCSNHLWSIPTDCKMGTLGKDGFCGSLEIVVPQGCCVT